MGKFEYAYTFETNEEITDCLGCRFFDIELDCTLEYSWSKSTPEEQFEECPLTKRVRGGETMGLLDPTYGEIEEALELKKQDYKGGNILCSMIES